MYKGGAKLFFLFIIILMIVIPTVIFTIDYHGDGLTGHVQKTAENVIEEQGRSVAKKVVEEGKEKIGEALKDTGEKILYEEFENPGYFGEYDDGILKEYENRVLFFTADWCPSCTEAKNAIDEKMAYIPSDTAIMTVDFDMSDLKEKYSVTRQHTFILLDNEGNEIKRWTNSMNLEDIIYNTK